MGFKEAGVRFERKVKFKDYALNFVSSEASRFSKDDGKDASAKVDLTLSGAASYSSSKSKAKAREMKKFLQNIEKENRKNDVETKETKGKTESKDLKSKETIKKSISKETRKAASKIAVAKALRIKGMIGNDLSAGNATGDAFKDGNSGAVKVITETLNPMTYLKNRLVRILGAILPHAFLILTFLIVFMILISLVAGMLSSTGNGSSEAVEMSNEYGVVY